MQIPLFPLNVVLFPEGELKLRIFEPRYIDMVSDCLRNDTGFGVCLIQEDKDDSPVERRNWRYNSLKQLQNYNKSAYDLLSDEHKNEIQSLGTNMGHIIDYETLFEKLVFIY